MEPLATLTSPTTLELPKEIAKKFQIKDRFSVRVEGDTLLFQRVKPVSIGEIVARAEQIPDDDPPTMEEISAIVHEVRRQVRAEG
jgi:hypothetical protein